MTKVKKMVAKNDLESMKLIYEPDMADLKKSRASLNNKKMSKLKRMRKKRKLKFNQLMAESTLSRTLVLETKITKCKQLEKLAKKLLKNRSVQMVMLDYMSKSNTIADGQPNDFYFSNRGQFAFNYQEGPLWGLKKINTPQVWQDNQGEETIVAVVDSGVDYNHPDIRNNILRDENDNIIGSDFAADDSDPMDVTGHGTQVAGIIAAEGDNNIGMIGVAPRARIMPVRVIGDDGTGSFSDIADGVEFAVNNEADVINLSLGSEVIDSGINRFLARSYPQNVAYRNAINAGVILIKAAGNSSINVNGGVPDGERSQLFDAAVTVPELITVGASTRDDTRAEFSNFGSEQLVDIAAPGGSNTTVNVTPRPDMTPFLDIRFFTNLRQIFDIFPGLSTTKLNILSLACSVCPDTFVHLEGRAESVTVDNSPSYTPSSGGVHSATINLSNIDKVNSDYSTTDGTSFAAPYVAGAAALVRSVVPDLNQADMRELLVNNAQAITTDENIGPRLDIARVFNYLKNLPSPELNSPADSFTTKLNRRPSFEWTRVVGAEYYNLMINETVIRSSETSKTLEQDLTAGSHNWKVQACNSLACGEFSDSRVIVVEEFDIVPEIVSPLSDSILEVSDFIIGWQPIPGASISYSYNVVNVDTGETVANDTVFGAFPRSENLEAGNYELQLQACLGNECSDFARRNFTLIPDIPFAANFTNEIGETTNVQPSFSWESIINAHNYNLTIKRAADEQVIFSTELSETSLSLLIPFKPGSYIAELNTCNDHGCSNTVSQAFTILASERPSQPEFSSFDLIGETQNKNPQTSWRDNINTEFYSIKVIDFNNQEIETA
ncbi:MAG: S8 family serine peptidase, partial [Candidatus Melainabacteria bacterium]|nr:S8 family serine peptidase [Candidatus Melainabacteria bacterium]